MASLAGSVRGCQETDQAVMHFAGVDVQEDEGAAALAQFMIRGCQETDQAVMHFAGVEVQEDEGAAALAQLMAMQQQQQLPVPGSVGSGVFVAASL